MIYIEKNCPRWLKNKLSQIQKTEEWKNAKWQSAWDDFAPKAELRVAIRVEQHGICAYCMSRLKPADALRGFTIEHRIPRSLSKDHILDYQNLLGVCDGGGKNSNTCCDNAKENQEITIDPTRKDHIDQISFRKDGRIHTENQVFQSEINFVLRLNGMMSKNGEFLADTETKLVLNRRTAARNCQELFQKLSQKNRLTVGTLERLIENLESAEEYDPYIGVSLFFFRKKLTQL